MALEEVQGSLSRMADRITSTPQEPCEPVREPQKPLPTNNNTKAVAPRTPAPSNGGSSGTQCTGGVVTVFPAQDVRIKQGTVKPNTTPAGDRLRTEQEPHQVQAGAEASPNAPYPLQIGVMCLPLCYQ